LKQFTKKKVLPLLCYIAIKWNGPVQTIIIGIKKKIQLLVHDRMITISVGIRLEKNKYIDLIIGGGGVQVGIENVTQAFPEK